MAMIEVEELRKSYGSFEALRGISFHVDRGEIVGFLGPNGAGKTTCMKVITGYMAATAGTVRVDGVDVHEDSLRTRAKIGYLPENAPIYPDMMVHDYLRYVADLRGIPKGERAAKMRSVAEACGLREVAGKLVSELSKGYRQRVGLAQALIHDPEVLILDEPTAGLDPNQIVEIRELVKRLGKQRTIILSTHNLPEVLQTCDRMVIVHQGRLVADGTPAELEKSAAANPPVMLRVGANGASEGDVRAKLGGVARVTSVAHRGTVDGAHDYLVTVEQGADARPALAKAVLDAGWQLYELRRDALDLEGIFRRLTQQA
jgi:ABC-2 type transport system ATP-binding protein